MMRGAKFDATGVYRYSLWREWDVQAPRIGFVMLNPSRADAVVDDPTIRRCIGFARTWSYGSLEVVNLFAYRTSEPKQLNQVSDPIGAENDRYLLSLGQRVDRIVLAWGNWGTLHDRSQVVIQLFDQGQLFCLGVTKTGQPRHPLYLKGTIIPQPFKQCPNSWGKF